MARSVDYGRGSTPSSPACHVPIICKCSTWKCMCHAEPGLFNLPFTHTLLIPHRTQQKPISFGPHPTMERHEMDRRYHKELDFPNSITYQCDMSDGLCAVGVGWWAALRNHYPKRQPSIAVCRGHRHKLIKHTGSV